MCRRFLFIRRFKRKRPFCGPLPEEVFPHVEGFVCMGFGSGAEEFHGRVVPKGEIEGPEEGVQSLDEFLGSCVFGFGGGFFEGTDTFA